MPKINLEDLIKKQLNRNKVKNDAELSFLLNILLKRVETYKKYTQTDKFKEKNKLRSRENRKKAKLKKEKINENKSI